MALLIVFFEFLKLNNFYVFSVSKFILMKFVPYIWLYHNSILCWMIGLRYSILNSYTYYTEWLSYFHHSHISHISGDWIFSMPQRNFICKYTWSFMSFYTTNVKFPLKYCQFKCQHWLESMSRNTVILNVKTCYTFYISDITVWMAASKITFYCQM